MPISANTQEAISELDRASSSAHSAKELMEHIISTLSHLPRYNWVGFYMVERQEDGDDVLVLGPYAGAPTPHTRIPLDRGICGAAASSGKTVVVDDVNSDPRYLACSIETRSEIVVPVYANGKVAGELDIDSHSEAAFGAEDRAICEHAAQLVGAFLERSS